MVRHKTGDKLGDIRRATVAEVVEVGSSAASVNAIARRADLAVGTIYRYYESKDQLLRAVYLAIKSDLHDAMMASVAESEGSKAKIQSMWFNVLQYAYAKPHDFLFAEVVMNATLLSTEDRQQTNAMSREAMEVIEAAIADGTLRQGDTRAMSILLIAPALQLGRATALGGERPEKKQAREIFSLCWRAIAN